MAEETDAEYYERRAQEKLKLAETIGDKSIKAIHLVMAARYATMAEQGDARPSSEGK